MFEVGFTEILLIFGIALLVLGPTRLPKLAADVGRWAGRARSMARQLRTQLEQETQFDPLKDIRTDLQSTTNSIHTPSNAAPAPADDSARAAPAQTAESMPAPTASSSSDLPPPAADDVNAAAPSPTTTADEPKHG